MGYNDAFPRIGPHDGKVTEDYVESSIHDGKVFRGHVNQTLGSGSALTVMVTGFTGEEHISFNLNTNGPGLAVLYKGATASGGTAITMYNAKQASTNTSNLTVTYDPTVATVGTIIDQGVFGTTGVAGTKTGVNASSDEWIPQEDSIWLVRFTASAADVITIIKVISEED